MKLTSGLFEAFLKCPTKCYLRSTGQTGVGNAYADWVREENDAYRKEVVQRLETVAEGEAAVTTPGAVNLKTATWRLAVDLSLETETMASRLHAVERMPSESRGRPAQFIPVRFVFFNKLTKDDRLLLAFDALVLSAALGRVVGVGKIIHGDDYATLKVKVASLLGTVRKLTGNMSALLAGGSPPDLVLNRHCGECEFRDGCRQKALEKDDLSLLGGMSAKERQKLRSKGIFTVTQLSYTFRPRRRPKRQRDKREKYHHSLKALAIREKKIHIVGSPELRIEGTPVYFDVEGLPDREFYYLIGVRIGNGDSTVQHSLWADTVEDEGRTWREFLSILETVERPVLIHYGSYESEFMKRMFARYGSPCQNSWPSHEIGPTLNLLSFVYAQIYFPGFSNSLKDAAGFLGFTWTPEDVVGVQSIACRHRWEYSHNPAVKATLVNYNAEDCRALEVVAHALSVALGKNVLGLPQMDPKLDITRADDLPSMNSKWRPFTSPIPTFEAINKAAQWDYQRDRIYLRRKKQFHATAAKPKWHAKTPVAINREIVCEKPFGCPRCGKRVGRPVYTRTKVMLDMRFSKFGLRRWAVRYHYSCYYCRPCQLSFGRPKEFWQRTQYGRNLVALLTFRIIELCDSQTSLAQDMNRFYGFSFDKSEIHLLKASAAKFYKPTRDAVLDAILKGKLVQADETRVVLHRTTAYVWVLATIREVVFFYAESREGDFIQNMLRGFQGVLISDFYAAYDSIQCPQQKCLIHLIRDLNDALMECPYDEELRLIVTSFGDLLRMIVGTIDRWGLKRRFLRKHQLDVRRFYRRVVRRNYRSEAALKWKERFEKNQDKLFTFLNYDGVPWNNNNAEHAIKAFASLRRTIEAMSTAKGIEEYLILLSVSQTCKCMGVDFLDFLRSGEKDLYAFAESRRGRRRRQQQAIQPKTLPADEGSQK